MTGFEFRPLYSPMLLHSDDFLFPRTLDSLATGCVMGICAQWPLLWKNGNQNMLARAIARRLAPVLNMALAVEMAEARENGLLKADTPEGRYHEFDEMLASRRLQDVLLDKYKGLSSLPWSVVSDWSFEFDAMLRRLRNDATDIGDCLGIPCGLGGLAGMEADCADLHEGGAGVCMLHFHDGKRLVYKPRPMAADVLFARLAPQLNAELGWQAYQGPATLDMGPYGWQQFIERTPCENMEDVRLFFQRQGANLALVYLLGGVDFHAENMVPSESFPVPVDLETAMQPLRTGVHTLRRSGMVPVPGRDYDYSALGCAPAPDGSFKGFVWRDRGRDSLHMELAELPCTGPYCLPFLDGEHVPVCGFEMTVAASFARTLKTLAQAFETNRDLMDTVAEMPIRFIHRPTLVYQEILTASLHPENLRSMEGRREFIETQLGLLGPETPAQLFGHEADTLEEGYIPTCHTRADSRDLWFGAAIEDDFFPATTLDQIRVRVREAPVSCGRLRQSLLASLGS
ncbi:DUF4135 domain-containing protein [Salidesulfovibrio onnuriiensis]|uniref:DUF4135 domain-containing protein n=1 Tax=Salidesulfovibrio onnuriiensis TaxID=2583823 RepID=UPI0011C7C234|nr:DUF4135 domain-containing protein [Salidesulfovibrio onnuriiensis]